MFIGDQGCGDEDIQDDPRLSDVNVDRVVDRVIRAAKRQAAETRGDISTMNIMWTMGSDFQYENAEKWFINLDRAIKAVNANQTAIKLQYSTPSLYIKAKNAEQVQWPTKTDDYFPYADGADNYWTGYFTSRPALKGYVRTSSSFLQVVRHFEVFSGGDGAASELFWDAQSVAQHHDAVSGTAKQAVTFDYAQRISKGFDSAATYLHSALAKTVSRNGQATLNFTHCPLANVSICPATQAGGNIVAVVYNPAAHALGLQSPLGVQAVVRVPVPSKSYQVYGVDGKLVPSQQTVPVLPTQAQPSGAAQYEAIFAADVAGLGLTTAFLTTSGAEEEGEPMSIVETDAATTIENQYYQLTFDSTTGLLNGVVNKADGAPTPSLKTLPGIRPIRVIVQKISLYNNNPAAIEFEWTVGPIPVDDKQGKEVIIRFNQTDIASNATWYTDSNGREFQERVRSFRPTWKWVPTQPVAGNYVRRPSHHHICTSSLSLTVDSSLSFSFSVCCTVSILSTLFSGWAMTRTRWWLLTTGAREVRQWLMEAWNLCCIVDS
jgi:lysosomal alpha-mannosidase